MYLDYAEFQASKGKPMYMRNWAEKLNAFLQFNEEEILQDKGKISKIIAHELATEKLKKYRIKQDKNYMSDFDKAIKQLKNNSKSVTKYSSNTDDNEKE